MCVACDVCVVTHKQDDPLGEGKFGADKDDVHKQYTQTVEKREHAHGNEILRKPGETPSVEPAILPTRGHVLRHVPYEFVERIVNGLEICLLERVEEF